MKIIEETLLQELKLPYLEVILEEIFLLNPLHAPKTVGELSLRSGLLLEETKNRLSKLKEQSENIKYQGEIPPLEEYIYLDVSLEKTSLNESFQPLMRLYDAEFKDGLLKLKKTEKLILVISISETRSFSAAMYLRDQGFKNVFMLEACFL